MVGTGSPMYGTTYITLHGLEQRISLPRDVIKKAVQRLEQAGLVEANKQCDAWRVERDSAHCGFGVIGYDWCRP